MTMKLSTPLKKRRKPETAWSPRSCRVSHACFFLLACSPCFHRNPTSANALITTNTLKPSPSYDATLNPSQHLPSLSLHKGTSLGALLNNTQKSTLIGLLTFVLRESKKKMFKVTNFAIKWYKNIALTYSRRTLKGVQCLHKLFNSVKAIVI